MSYLAATQYPWLQPILAQLTLLATQQRMAHALLISGMAGLGKRPLANALSAFLLCKQPINQQACGQCKSCLLLAAGNHPDILLLNPESNTIGVDDIRRLIEFTQGAAQQQGNRVIILPQAQRMSEAAANALLKTLEEPPQGCFLLLLSEQPQRLKATLLSRCQQWRVAPLNETALLSWLAEQCEKPIPAFLYRYTGGAPLQALALLEGSEAQHIATLLHMLQAFMQEEVALAVLVKELENRDDNRAILGFFIHDALQSAQSISAERLQRIYQRYYRWCRDEQQILGQNKSLALSALLLEIQRITATR